VQELVPDFLKKIPADPYDGNPLRLKKQGDDLIAYSVGPDRVDNEGTLAVDGQDPQGKDIGFRLWDAEKRRQLPLPEKLPMPTAVH
jgi:hypothetical protein